MRAPGAGAWGWSDRVVGTRRKEERKQRLLKIGQGIPFRRIWGMSAPELLYVLVASLGATVGGTCVRARVAWRCGDDAS